MSHQHFQQRKPRESHQGKRLRFEGTRWPCPHCKACSHIRTSRMVSDTMREAVYACSNPECGHTYVVRASADYTLSPSATPNPAVRLPLSSHVRRGLVRAQLDCAQGAEHEAQFTPAQSTGDLFEVPAALVPPR